MQIFWQKNAKKMRFFVILPIFEQNCPKNGVFFGLILDNFLVSFVHRLQR